jgi:hypothetical protein
VPLDQDRRINGIGTRSDSIRRDGRSLRPRSDPRDRRLGTNPREDCLHPWERLTGSWRAVIHLDENSSPEQRRVLLDVITSELGGPLADLAKLVSETLDVRVAPIEYHVHETSLRLGALVTESSRNW